MSGLDRIRLASIALLPPLGRIAELVGLGESGNACLLLCIRRPGVGIARG